MIRILLVDDQNLVQQGIKSLLERDQNFEVIGTVDDGKSAITQVKLLRPDIVLLDIEMPEMNGITVTKYINHFLPETKVIILSSHEEKKYLVQALVAGARSYILKSSLMKDLKQAILAVHNGYSLIESRLLTLVLNSGTVKLVPVKSETILNTSEPKRKEASQLANLNHDESDLLLMDRDEAEQNSVNKLATENLTETTKTSAFVQPEAAQNTSINKDSFPQEHSEVASQLNHQNSNLEDISSNLSIGNSDPTNSVLGITENISNISPLEKKTEEKKTESQSGDANSLPESTTKDDIFQNDQAKLQAFKQDVKSSPLYNLNLDEPSYHNQIRINQLGLNMASNGDETALVPVSPSRGSVRANDNSEKIFGANIARSTNEIVLSKKSYLHKIYNQSEIQKLRSKIDKLLKPISSKLSFYFKQHVTPLVSKYQPFINQYKSRFFKLISQRSTKKTLWNVGFMILGGIIVLLIYSF